MNLQIYEEASEWIVKHRDGGLDAREKKIFDEWLRESPQHVRAYLEMSSVWEDVPLLDPTWNPEADELVARARGDDNVVSLAPPSHAAGLSLSEGQKSDNRPRDTRERSVPSNRNVKLRYALAASMLLAFAATWFLLQRGVYTTDTGEQRSLALTDGSTVELNSRSRIKVKYTSHERRIDLLEGQALFHVAKGQARPFIVQTGDTRVRAVGTAFDVHKTSAGSVVTVVEGRVAVRANQQPQGANRGLPGGVGDSPQTSSGAYNSGTATVEKAPSSARAARQHEGRSASAIVPEVTGLQAGAGEILLAAGEQLVVTPAIATSPKRANVAAVTAWTRRSLVFDSSPLTEVAEEFNRYNTRRLVIEDPQLAGFLVSGVFSSVEPTLFIKFLRTQPELVVEETDTEIRITKK